MGRDDGRLNDGKAATAPDEKPVKGDPHYRNHRQRLRERVLDSGPESLPDYELLELLLFYSIERVDVKPLAKQLIADFGGFGGVLAASRHQLEKYPRVTERTVVQFTAVREAARRILRAEIENKPVLSSWTQLLDYCRACLVDEQSEQFRVLYLNCKNILIADEVQQRGTVDHTPVYPREVIKRALELGATALIMLHNHPSGDPTPSRADIDMTHEVRDAAQRLGISVHDHVIVGRDGVNSFRTMGLI